MQPRLTLGHALLAVAAGLLLASPARAASLQQVDDWGSSGMPSDVSMYIYVPDKVADNPPILTLIHYCGGTASAVFGQAQGGGIVSKADQYGFIMVVPSCGRCWDVMSDKTWKREGGGDSHAIRQMVQYAVEQYKGNADRAYATGDSSGAMMTELLIALYPDVFKGGSTMAGMPAGCRGSGESGNSTGYSGACAGGSVDHTAQEWADIVDQMYPGYSGHRGRVQLFHGDADTTIRYKNHTEAIEEWIGVLGLDTTPDSETTVTLGNHQATRQQWENSCGYVVLDAFTSKGGDHGPSDALFKAEYVIPFLGLDKTGDVDPEIAQCSGSTGGSSGTGGDAGTGGALPTGGGGGAPSGGVGGAATGGAGGRGIGGVGGRGGAATGGETTSGGTTSTGGSEAAGTSAATGGEVSSGGVTAMGGTAPLTGGVSSGGVCCATGGMPPTGGSTSSGGSSAGGGLSGGGGSTAAGSGATSGSVVGTGGGTTTTSTDASSDEGCGCRVGGGRSSSSSLGGLGALVLLAFRSFGRRVCRTRVVQ
ncbi:MAG: PHB depolymerase family esterase [Polyangiaceae bacterium]|nr:PHB depolymerase family esterase [Polyangiaceae bacterium]